MKKLIAFSFIALLLFTGVDCKDEPVQPPNNNDTTSHNFSVLRVDTLGTMFSFANGVDIVDENNIWVAGIFTERDTNGEILYNKNLAHWDGVTWTMMSVPMMGYNNTGPDPQELKAVKVFNDSNIFVISKYNSHARWDGKKWISYYVEGKGILDVMWARSSDDIYFVGAMGSATHWDGQTFTRMTTGLTTNAMLIDVWGDENTTYALGSSNDMKENAILYSGNASSWTIANKYSIDNQTLPPPSFYMGRVWSVFRANKNSKLWVIGGENHGWLYEVTSLSPFSAKVVFVLPDVFYPRFVRGNADNDLFLVGELDAKLWHYNASTWKLIEPNINDFRVIGCSVKNSTVVLVGESFDGMVGKGIVITLKHI
jgi:hypothetical protein